MLARRRAPRGWLAGVLTALVAVSAGCQFLPIAPTVDCGDVPRIECERQAASYVEEARRMQPPKRVVGIRMTLHDGGEVRYDDGSAMAWIP